ncbi:MAG: hypothetical protein D6690_08040 [Nitrospirae bacterium]|nr:MAG: hypothetical protein D6690_08040 [Nitrospirota bacterium]
MRLQQGIMVLVLCLISEACETPRPFTVTIEDSPDRVVRLQAVELADPNRGFSHPATVNADTIEQILRGIIVEIPTTPFSSSGTRHLAFAEGEAKALAHAAARGLSQATPEELVTFFESQDIDEDFRAITSGGMFVQDEFLYLILSNYRVKRPIWQDNEQYDAPYRLRPLEPIAPQPGRVSFERPNAMAPPLTDPPFDLPVSTDWVVGVRYASP